ncbi:MAG: hypothetical protein GX242_01500 [Clostridiales bacterium]|nr:hypothetical protein [Clostridiales bacterium]
MLQTINNPLGKILGAIKTFQGTTKEQKQGNKTLIDTLREMESAYLEQMAKSVPDYDKVLPKSTGGTLKTYQEKSHDELQNQAEDMVVGDIETKINKLNQTTEKKINDLAKKLSSSQEVMEIAAEKSQDKLQDTTITNLYNATNKGIVNSSIYENLQQNAYDIYKEELIKIKNDFDTLNSEIEKEISVLSFNKQTALREFDLEKAVKIEKQLDKLKSDQQATIASINSYNKKILDAETKFQQDRVKTMEKMASEWRKAKDEQYAMEKMSGYTGDNLTEMNKRYELAKDFYFSISKQNAKKLIEQNQNALKEALGEVYYKRLYEENNNR